MKPRGCSDCREEDLCSPSGDIRHPSNHRWYFLFDSDKAVPCNLSSFQRLEPTALVKSEGRDLAQGKKWNVKHNMVAWSNWPAPHKVDSLHRAQEKESSESNGPTNVQNFKNLTYIDAGWFERACGLMANNRRVGVSWHWLTLADTPTGCVVLNKRSVQYVPEVRGLSITGHGRKNENGIYFHWRNDYVGDSVSSGGRERPSSEKNSAFWGGLPGERRRCWDTIVDVQKNQPAPVCLCRAELFRFVEVH